MAEDSLAGFGRWIRGLPARLTALEELRGEPLVVEFDAEPHEAAKRLLASLGCEWVVKDTPAHALTEVVICAAYGCTKEAEFVGGDVHGLCAEHAEIKVKRGSANGHAGVEALARMDAGEPQQPAKRGTCRTEGCPNDRNTRYDRGMFSGLCEEVCIPARREEASKRSKEEHAARREGRAGDVNQVAAAIVAEATVGQDVTVSRWSRGGRPQKWDRAAVVEAIKLWGRENGRFPTSGDLEAPHDERFPSYKAVLRSGFDTFADALATAGCLIDVPAGRIRVEPDGTVVVLDDVAVVPQAEPVEEAIEFAQAALQLQEAYVRYQAASDELDQARDRFVKHPLLTELLNERILDPSDLTE